MSSLNIGTISNILHESTITNLKTDVVINHFSIDSRTIHNGSNTLFFAIHSKRQNGHDFVNHAYSKGCRAFVISEWLDFFNNFTDATFIQTKNTIDSLQLLASAHRKEISSPIVSITGSNGKTIVKEWLYQCLNQDFDISRSPRSFNSQLGTPISVLGIDKKSDLSIIEAGISMIGEMEKLEKIIKPNFGIITNIGDPHQINFNSIEEKLNEKLNLFSNSEKIFYSKDHTLIHKQVKERFSSKKLINWSFKEDADLTIKVLNEDDSSTTLKFTHNNNSFEAKIPFSDNASIENICHVVLFLCHMNINQDEIAQRISNLDQLSMRLEIKKGVNNCTIINDYYNFDLGSLNNALDLLKRQNQHNKKSVIISDIIDSYIDEKTLYTNIAKTLKDKNISRIIGIGENITKYKNLFECDTLFYPSTNSFLEEFDNIKFADEAILIKGSRTFKFEEVSRILEKHQHHTTLEVDLDAMSHNLNYYRNFLKEELRLLPL